ncbi:FUSC family protein [Ponticoccus alexandrii]|uniref:FUSC family protein n=1 Tax=Ponticoccus alexandrii TaxID=1943633 RepID=A0ABX7FI29_9RHOB|nr:FUSC family protein [Ponticoccus alexandrii]ETA49423.1 hypothetical protein P279_24870 [Rhodobacteraceae bacterium PD-2]QRF69323.1 FUSC family protein [Ponticoccus alexandrii]
MSRPSADDDPHYGIRPGLTGPPSYAALPLLDPALPPIVAARLLSRVAAMITRPWIMTWLADALRPVPLDYVIAMWGLYFAGFLMVLRSGAQTGMLIVIVTVLMSVMGMQGSTTAETIRDGFMQAAFVALVVGPLVYLLVPPRTADKHVDDPLPGHGNAVTGAAIRTTVLLALSVWLYAVMQPTDMMMAVIAAMVLVFPTSRAVFSEAFQRLRATLFGAALALAALMGFTLSPHLPIILGLIFLGGLWLGQKMLFGPHPGMVYQYAFWVILALVAGALIIQNAGHAAFTRIVLTVTGAFSAACAVALLDALTGWRPLLKENLV